MINTNTSYQSYIDIWWVSQREKFYIVKLSFGSIPFKIILILGESFLRVKVLVWCIRIPKWHQKHECCKYSYSTNTQKLWNPLYRYPTHTIIRRWYHSNIGWHVWFCSCWVGKKFSCKIDVNFRAWTRSCAFITC